MGSVIMSVLRASVFEDEGLQPLCAGMFVEMLSQLPTNSMKRGWEKHDWIESDGVLCCAGVVAAVDPHRFLYSWCTF